MNTRSQANSFHLILIIAFRRAGDSWQDLSGNANGLSIRDAPNSCAAVPLAIPVRIVQFRGKLRYPFAAGHFSRAYRLTLEMVSVFIFISETVIFSLLKQGKPFTFALTFYLNSVGERSYISFHRWFSVFFLNTFFLSSG